MRKLLVLLAALCTWPAQAAMKVAIVEATAANGTPTYTQDFTDSTTFGGATPKCAIVLGSAATANHSSTATVQATIGFIASAQASIGISDNDATSTNTASYANYSTQAYSLPDFAGNTVGDATGSLIANGARLSWTDQSQGELVKVILIGGDVECAVSSLTSNNGTSAQAVTHGLTAAPQFVMAMSPGQASGDSSGNARYTVGFYDGTNQKSVGVILNQSGQTTVTSFGRVSSTRILGSKAASAGFNWDATISNVGATTFDITLSAATTNLMHFLSLRSTSGTALGVKAGTFGTKTTTGTNADISGMSQSPQLVLYALSRSIAVDTNYSGADDATVLGLGIAVKNTGTGSTQYATIVNADADGSATSGTHAYTQASATQAIRILDVNGSDTVQATINSWDSGGVTNNYTAVSTQARQVVYGAIGADVTATPSITAGPTAGTATTTSLPATATTNQDTTLKGVLVTDGSGAPSCTQVQAGQDSSSSAAYATCSVSLTATVSGSCDFTGLSGAGAGNVRDAYYCGRNANGDTSVAAIADRYKVPAFSTAPSITGTTSTSITVGGTVDGAGTSKAVACKPSLGTPSAAEILAATPTCAGGVAALAYGSDDSSLSIALSSLGIPLVAVHTAATYGAGGNNSAVQSFTDQCLAAPSGRTLVNCPTGLTSVHANSPWTGFNAQTDPDVIAGDIPVCDSTTTPNAFDLTFTATGLYNFAGTGAPQTFDCSLFDRSADAMHADTLHAVVNNPSPVAQQASVELILTRNVAMQAQDVCALINDPAGETVTCTSSDTGEGTGADKRPAGVTATAGNVTGTPTGAGGTTGSFTVTGADPVGNTAAVLVSWSVRDQIEVPDCVGLTRDACAAALNALGFALDTFTQCDDATGFTAGTVVSQYPAAASNADYGTTVRAVRWNGRCPTRNSIAVPSKKYVRNTAIPSVNYAAYFNLGDASFAACSLRTLGSAFSSTTAVGAGTASQFLTLADATDISPGDWLKIGTSTYRQVLTVNWSTGLVKLRDAATWSNGAAVDALTVLGATIPGLSFAPGTCVLSGTPTVSAATTNLLIRAQDAAGNTVDVP